MSLVVSVVELVTDEAARRKISCVRRVNLKIGRLQAIAPDALRFCFGECTKETVAEDAELIIEEVPIRIRCTQCDSESEISDYRMHCRACGSDQVTVIGGKELELESFEV